MAVGSTDRVGPTLCRTNLKMASLSWPILSGADLHGAIYSEDTIWPEGFRPPPAAIKMGGQ